MRHRLGAGNDLDRVAIGIGNPGRTQPAVKECMRIAERSRASFDHLRERSINVIGPEEDLGSRVAISSRQTVGAQGGLNRGPAQDEASQTSLDVLGRAGRGRLKRVVESEQFGMKADRCLDFLHAKVHLEVTKHVLQPLCV